MRARQADHEGYLECHGVTIGYEVYGEWEPTVLLQHALDTAERDATESYLLRCAGHLAWVSHLRGDEPPGGGGADRDRAEAHRAAGAAVIDRLAGSLPDRRFRESHRAWARSGPREYPGWTAAGQVTVAGCAPPRRTGPRSRPGSAPGSGPA